MDVTRIYLVENCFGDPNKMYIGKTKGSREKNHKKTYGSQIFYTYIDEVEGCKKEDWKSLECFWIEQFRQWGFELMNKNEGGGGPTFHTEETKQKMSKSQKGRVISEEAKQKMRDTKKDKRKITDEQIKEIRENPEKLRQCEFAIKFNVSKQLICNIIHCKGSYALPI